MNTNKLRLLTAALAAALPIGARAAYEDVGVGARVTGLGHAYTAVADDVYASYYNPAGLALLKRPELGTTYAKLLTGLSDGSNLQNSFLAYAHPLQGGERGTVAGAWNHFTLSGLYQESQFIGSYARPVFSSRDPEKYYLGGSVKILRRGVGGTAESANAISNTGAATGAPDPALAKASKVNLDADLGFLWRVKPRWMMGLMIQHVPEPDVAFNGGDKLGRNVKAGVAYKTPFSTLSTDLCLQSAPDGSMDKIIAVAAEKWLPTLLHGSFGVRGSLSAGTRDHRQLSAGLSYKLHRMQFDYGFALPIGGLTGTSGSHRMGLTLRFGRARSEEALFSEAILESITEIAPVGTVEFQAQLDELAQFQRGALMAFLTQAKADAAAGRLADAAGKLNQALSVNPKDEGLRASLERMTLVAEPYPEVKDFKSDAGQAVILEGALQYASGRAKDALNTLAYAMSLKPGEPRLETLVKSIAAKAGLPAPAAPAAPVPPVVEPVEPSTGVVVAPTPEPTPAVESPASGLVVLMEAAMREKDWSKVVEYGEKVVSVDPKNGLAYKRLGAAYYAQKKPELALQAMRTALSLETDEAQRSQLRSYISALAAVLHGRRTPERAAPVRPTTPAEVERLYELGVELYSQGRLSEAAAAFKRAVAADPSNASARRALDRVNTELLQTGGKR